MKLLKLISWKKFSTILVIFFMLVILGGAVTNCGTRSTEIKKEYVKKDSVISTLTHVKIKVDSNYTIDFSSFKIYPIDLTKPIVVNGTKIENATIEKTTKKEMGNVSKVDNSIIKIDKKSTSIESKKEVQKESSDYSNLWIGLLAVLMIFIYFKTGTFRE